MYAQLIESRTTPERVDDLARTICREVFVSLREQPGFCGGLSLVDRDAARAVVVLLWETDEQAARPLDPRAASILLRDAAAAAPSVLEVDARA